MSKLPFLPLDVDAYFGATRHLTTEEHGAYLLLLMEAWRRPNASIPNDDAKLARLACLSLDRWQAVKGEVLAFWKYDGRSKEYTQERLKKERKYVADKRHKNRDNAVSRWNKTKKPDANAYANVMHFTPSLSQGSKEPLGNDNFKGKGVSYSKKEISDLVQAFPHVDVNKKLSEQSFLDWALREEPRQPKRAIYNWLKRQDRQNSASDFLDGRVRELSKGMKL